MPAAHMSVSDLPPIVLVVEDDLDTNEMYEAALGLSGFWVATSANPGDALAIAAELRPDSILMDVGLPTWHDGLDLARAFRQHDRLAETPIVAVTGLQPPPALHSDMAVFSRVFHKPVDMLRVLRQVRWLCTKTMILRERADRVQAQIPALMSKAAALQQQATSLKAERKEISAQSPLLDRARSCPYCGRPLRFSEQRHLDGTTFDYYRPCEKGCGLYCWDHSQRKMITLIG